MGKVFKWLFLFALLGGVGWVAFKWYRAQQVSVEAFRLIPPDAIYCLATTDPTKSWKDIAGSRAWSHLQKNGYFASLTASANSLDSLIRQNDLLFKLIGSRSLIVSAHMTGKKQYDFLFLVDLKEASGIKFLNEYLTSFSASGYSIHKQKYAEEDLVILSNPSNQTNLYLSLPGTYLLASYTKNLITSALDAQKSDTQNNVEKNEIFIKTEDDLGNNEIVRLYVNYALLPQFMKCYLEGSNEYIQSLSRALQTTSLNLTLEDELIKATGHTYVVDSVESYLKTLSISGKGPTESMEIAPQRTAFYVGFGFTSFAEFFKNFEKNLKLDVTEYTAYRANLKQVEDYLKINLQQDFINWIGDEVALFELQSSGTGLDAEVALALKADNIEKAKKDLAHIEKMVRKKTPVKFKTVDHRGFAINYLSMKGLFKVLLGKFFARYDKPYYTIINNFVIFSNHPQTLEGIIDDYLDKKTLIKSEEFRKFRKEFDDEGCAFIYLNTPVFFNTMKKLVDYPTRMSMERNKEYIICFRQIGFQLVPEEKRFKTLFAEQFVEPDEPSTVLAEINPTQPVDSTNEIEPTTEAIPKESDPMALPYIYVQNLNAKSYSGFFSDSTLQYKVELKNGFKDGSYTEYYQNGELKMKGDFKSDKRDGTWKLYNENGKLILKRNYNDDEITKEKEKN